MLSSTEREQFKNLNMLDSRTRANLLFRVSKKIEKNLSELSEINEVLRAIPEKNAKRILNDDMINSIFTLSENMIKIMGYVPIKEDFTGRAFVVRRGPATLSKDGKSKKFEVEIETATIDEMARQKLVDDHIDVLRHIMDPNAGLPLSKLPESIADRIYTEFYPVQEKFLKWGRPTLRDWNER